MEPIRRAIPLPAAAEQVWTAITAPSQVGRWLGGLDEDGTPGVRHAWILATDAVEHVRLWVEHVDPGRALTLRWSEFGVEPPSRVHLTVEPGPVGAVLRVRESFPWPRSVPRVSREVFWDDCAERLRRHLDPAATVPQGVRAIELDVRVPSSSWLPLHRGNVFLWLPVSGPGYPPTSFYVVDEAGPWRFPIRRVEDYFDERLTLSVDVGAGLTRAVVRTRHDGTGVVLSVRHTHWPAEAGLRGKMTRLRDVFEITWRESLARAVSAAGGEGGPRVR
ncbi:SRPBCC domain-containing protein [Nocardiopsis sp. NPDC006938]|uniref:SRPBCC domain-containing protein n=1 Tax=Nocardiopsis sp. NPDC006938 TaxID=3364337 RepID=UPI0036ABA25B